MYQFCNNIIPRKKVKDIYIDIYNKIFNKNLKINSYTNLPSSLEDIQTKKTEYKKYQNTELGKIEKKIKDLKGIFEDNEKNLLSNIKIYEDKLKNLTQQTGGAGEEAAAEEPAAAAAAAAARGADAEFTRARRIRFHGALPYGGGL